MLTRARRDAVREPVVVALAVALAERPAGNALALLVAARLVPVLAPRGGYRGNHRVTAPDLRKPHDRLPSPSLACAVTAGPAACSTATVRHPLSFAPPTLTVTDATPSARHCADSAVCDRSAHRSGHRSASRCASTSQCWAGSPPRNTASTSASTSRGTARPSSSRPSANPDSTPARSRSSRARAAILADGSRSSLYVRTTCGSPSAFSHPSPASVFARNTAALYPALYAPVPRIMSFES